MISSPPFSSQITSSLLMVYPRDFAFNEQTALDNEFQSNPSLSHSQILSQVASEFQQSVDLLRSKGIRVVVIDKNLDENLSKDKTPDAIFPNNWLSTTNDGKLFVFQMYTANRRLETKILPLIEKTLKQEGFQYKEVIEIKSTESEYLEGTGSMVFNKSNHSILAAISHRTHENLLKKYAEITGETIVKFTAKSHQDKPFYHTNIMLCVGEGFAVICLESIKDEEERKKIFENFKGLEIVEISLEQAEKSFCGNMLHVRSYKDPNEKFIVLSERALKGLKEDQKNTLEKYGKFVALPLKLVEDIGGGSARCMLCEIFLKNLSV